MSTRSLFRIFALLFFAIFNALLLAAPAPAQDRAKGEGGEKAVMVGGAPMLPSRNIVENVVSSKDHTTLVVAVKTAGLVDTLAGKGPLTLFAPTNAAFGKLPSGALDNLLKPENKAALTGILTYHVVAGNYAAADLAAMAEKAGGKAELTTVAGGTLTVTQMDGKWVVVDAAGNAAGIETADVAQANGVVHVIDAVLMPAK